MLILLLAIILLGVFTASYAMITNKGDDRSSASGGTDTVTSDALLRVRNMECCGQHAICEKDALLKAIDKGIEYYDDEDLDMYSGRAADNYTEEEEEDFRDVLYTMKEQEVAGWVRSLQLRGIELPPSVREEALFVMQFRAPAYNKEV